MTVANINAIIFSASGQPRFYSSLGYRLIGVAIPSAVVSTVGLCVCSNKKKIQFQVLIKRQLLKAEQTSKVLRFAVLYMQ